MDSVHCPLCNYGIPKLFVKQIKHNYICPRCSCVGMKRFYGIGSELHIDIVTNGRHQSTYKLPPPPLPVKYSRK